MKKYIDLLRPKHYIKNFLVLLPLVFGGRLLDTALLFKTAVGFVAFCSLSSLIYIINDIRDREQDALHPKKKNRPIASGRVKVSSAVALGVIMAAVTAALSVFGCFGAGGWLCLVAYFIINLGYSAGLKNVPILDVALLVSGFLLRVLFGSSITGISISGWLYLTVISVSFYMGFGKRRGEHRLSESDKRKVLVYYTKDFLDKNMQMFLTLSVVFYSLWSIGSEAGAASGNRLVWTVPLVICICLKYSLTVEGNSDGDPVEVIFQDKVLILLALLLAAVLFVLLYMIK